MTDRIAFIGVGNMGNPMADQLVKAGKKVKAYDVSQEMIKKAKDANLDVVETLDEVLEDANFIISMLPEGRHVKSLFLGEQGIIDKISKDGLIIDCSTIDIETSLLLGKEAKKRGIKMIDAPVTGGVMGAREGKLNFLVGGDDEAVNGEFIIRLFDQSDNGNQEEVISFENDKTSNILDTSIITKKEFWDKDLENKLTNILKRFKKNSNAS